MDTQGRVSTGNTRGEVGENLVYLQKNRTREEGEGREGWEIGSGHRGSP